MRKTADPAIERFQAWIDAQLAEAGGDVQIGAIADRALLEFRDDQLLWESYLPQIAYDAVQRRIARLRTQAMQTARAAARTTWVDRVAEADRTIPTPALVRHEERIAAFLANWREHVGDRHIRLGDMTRDDLLQAAAERKARGAVELQRAQTLERLAQPLRDGQTVSEGWSPDALVTMLQEAGTVPALAKGEA